MVTATTAYNQTAIPVMTPAQIFDVSFFDAALPVVQALRRCQEAGFRPAYAPEIASARTLARNAPRGESILWDRNYTTASLIATGRTRAGNGVVVVAHVPHHYLDPGNIETGVNESRTHKTGRFGYLFPPDEFHALVDLEDGTRVHVLDYYTGMRGAAMISTTLAGQHKLVAPILGSNEMVEPYLLRHKEVRAETIWFSYIDEVVDVPVARLLVLREDGIDAAQHFEGFGRFAGVRPQNLESVVTDFF